MSIRLGQDIGSLKAQRSLADATGALSTSYEILASGLRINRASDDASGLSIASSLRLDSRVYTQGIRNVNDGISLLNVAEAALTQLSTITARQQELATQAANGVFSKAQRSALHGEAVALRAEFNRIVASTSFNGLKLLDGSGPAELSIQLSYGDPGQVSLSLGKELGEKVGDGTFSGAVTAIYGSFGSFLGTPADFNGDGNIDLISGGDGSGSSSTSGILSISLGNGDGTFRAPSTLTGLGWVYWADSKDLNGDGLTDIAFSTYQGHTRVMHGNGDGTFKVGQTLFLAGPATSQSIDDFNSDGIADIGVVLHTTRSIQLFLGNANGSFSVGKTLAVVGMGSGMTAADMNNDGITDLVKNNNIDSTFGILIGNGNGTFRSETTVAVGQQSQGGMNVVDVNLDGNLDVLVKEDGINTSSLYLGNGDGSFKARRTIGAGSPSNPGDLNGDDIPDFLLGNQLLMGNGDGTFQFSSSLTGSIYATAFADVNNDGVKDLLSTSTYPTSAVEVRLGNGKTVPTEAFIDLRTQTSALRSLTSVQATHSRVAAELGVLGASLSRLESAGRTLVIQRENVNAASSRILDADIASETSKLLAAQIRQQASAAVLAHTSRDRDVVLRLLQE